ncbi:MAG: HDOD domain-containing protein [Lachnospiraceae bacterium]|nr:HDOD domain-containing protein [Lachnospiraceae bacterium]
MLGTLIPLFDATMQVKAYSIFAQKKNLYLNPISIGTASLDGAGRVLGLDIVESMGMHVLAEDRMVFVELNHITIFADIDSMYTGPHEKLVLLFDPLVVPTEMYINRLRELKEKGYCLAIRKLPVMQFEEYRHILELVDYILLDHKKIDMTRAKQYFVQLYPNAKLVAVNVNTKEEFDMLAAGGGYHYYEGDFFRIPANGAEAEVSPMKATYVELLNVVNDPDFQLEKAADIIGRDTALVISLLGMVNRMTVNSGISTVRHAAAMLGQRELKRWINAAVTKELCSDKPSEITRLSLLRARFAENLAPLFQVANMSSELFLMGLLSVLDVILDKSMEEALQMVMVSKPISDALLHNTGKLVPVYNFMLSYENADWQEVSRQMIINEIPDDKVYDAYTEALVWYREMFFGDVKK